MSRKHATIKQDFRRAMGCPHGGEIKHSAGFPGGGGTMQTSLIIESNGSGKEKLDKLLNEGWTVVSITANHGKSYNDFLIILEK